MSSPGVTFNLTCGKGVTELQNLASLRLSSFAESHQMQQKNFDVSPKTENVQTGFHRENDPSCRYGVKHPTLTLTYTSGVFVFGTGTIEYIHYYLGLGLKPLVLLNRG